MGSGQGSRFGTGMIAIGTGETHQRADFTEREAKLPCPADEAQPRYIVGIIAAKPAARPMRLRQQADPLVIADRLDVALRAAG